MAACPSRREAVPGNGCSGTAVFGGLHSLGFDCDAEVCEEGIKEAGTERSENIQVEVKMTVC